MVARHGNFPNLCGRIVNNDITLCHRPIGILDCEVKFIGMFTHRDDVFHRSDVKTEGSGNNSSTPASCCALMYQRLMLAEDVVQVIRLRLCWIRDRQSANNKEILTIFGKHMQFYMHFATGFAQIPHYFPPASHPPPASNTAFSGRAHRPQCGGTETPHQFQ